MRQVLTELVKQAGRASSRLILLGVSNTVDLAVRHLPLLAAAKVGVSLHRNITKPHRDFVSLQLWNAPGFACLDFSPLPISRSPWRSLRESAVVHCL